MPKIIAHRGASAYVRENTLKAYLMAFEQGADGIEGDFLLTKDRKIIAFHDLNTKRLLGESYQTKDLTLHELRMISSFQIPELHEVLDIIPEKKEIIIELKCGRNVERELMKIIEQSSVKLNQITVISFRLPTLIRLRKLCPKIKILWIRKFVKSSKGMDPNPEKIRQVIVTEKFNGISFNAEKLDEKMKKIFDKHLINIWTVDEPNSFRQLQKLGCTSISTNDPKTIIKSK